MDYLEKLKEFKFKPKQMAALPGITKKDREVVKYSGVDFYTNEKLRRKFISSLMKHTPTKSHKTIIKLIEKKIIIPVFLTKSTFSFFRKHHRKAEEQNDKFSGVYGFYTIGDKKIFILIDAGYRVLGWVPDFFLAGVTLHECMHMAAIKNPIKFMKANTIPVYQYYSAFLDYIFYTKDSDKKTILNWIMYIYGFECGINKMTAENYENKLITAAKASKSVLSDEEIAIRAEIIFTFTVGTYQSTSAAFVSMVRKYPQVYNGLMKAYEKAFKFKVIRTTAHQELTCISEVIGMLAVMELGGNKYVSNSLDILL